MVVWSFPVGNEVCYCIRLLHFGQSFLTVCVHFPTAWTRAPSFCPKWWFCWRLQSWRPSETRERKRTAQRIHQWEWKYLEERFVGVVFLFQVFSQKISCVVLVMFSSCLSLANGINDDQNTVCRKLCKSVSDSIIACLSCSKVLQFTKPPKMEIWSEWRNWYEWCPRWRTRQTNAVWTHCM